MVAKTLQTELLLELAFSASGEINEQLILKKSIPLYLKKLNCLLAAVIKRQNGHQEVIMLIPFVAEKSAEWIKVKNHFCNFNLKDDEPCSSYLLNEYSYYAFRLNDYGTLILGRQQAFDISFTHELKPVIDHLGKALLQASEIEQRKKTEEALQKSEEKFRTVFNESPVGIEIYQADGLQVDANKASLKMFGISSVSEIKKFNLFEGTTLNPEIREKLRKGEPVTYQSVFDFEKVKTLGQYKTERTGKAYFDYIVTPLMDETQKIVQGYLLQVQEITERKRSEQIQKVLYNISKAVIITDNLEQLIGQIRDELGTVIDTSNFYIALYDEATNTFTLPFHADEKDHFTSFPAGKSCTSYVIKTSKSLLANKKKIKKLIKSGDIELIGTSSEIWLGVPLIIDGKVTGVIAVQSYTDENAYNESDLKLLEFISGQISTSINRKKAEKELIKAKESIEISEKQFKTIFEKAPIGIALVDSLTGEIYQVNPKHANIVGRTVEEITNINWKSFTHPDDIMLNLKKLELMNEGKISRFQMEKRIFHKDGRLIWVNLVVEPVKGFNKPNPCHLAMMEDITEKRKIMEDLITSKEKAEESDRLKSAFLANMSHEIRTPMNGILGFAELLKEPHLSGEEQQKYISIIEKSGNRMLNIINDIIDLSKVESGQMSISISETDINEQIDEICSFFKPEVENKGVKLCCKKELPNEKAVIRTDREKIFAVLTNLVKNAIKFTNTGSIEIGYCLRETLDIADTPGDKVVGKEIHFFVKDTGWGIRKDQIETIFERFRQGSESLDRNYEGAGLGLSISKAYVEMLGGKIWAESKPLMRTNKDNSTPVGSIFHFTIPYITANEVKKNTERIDIATTESGQIKKLKILVAEDDLTSEIIISKAVSSFAKEIIKVENGKDAIKACKDHPDINLVFMDVKMPEIDGYEATRQIRQFNKDVVIIAQTAYALTGDREKAIEAGCNDYISKPIDRNKLLTLIRKHTQ